MNINKTTDECIVESSSILLKCLVDPNLSLIKKQNLIKWLICFFDYQDAINANDLKQINALEEKLILNNVPLYYQNALQEFKIANLFYKKNFTFSNLQTLFFNNSTKQIIKTIDTFTKKFTKVIETYNINLEPNFIKNFQLLLYTINYHLSYLFKNELAITVRTFIQAIKTKVSTKKSEQEVLLINLILKENEFFINKIQQIQLLNFIYKIDDIFQETIKLNAVDQLIEDLIFTEPKKMTISMHQLLKENQIDIYTEIWNKNYINEKNSKLIMHLFAYETYFIQGYDNQEIYENLILKNIMDQEKYWTILHKYKIRNKIVKN